VWPFDKILEARIRELERTIEIVTGANNILERELGRSQSQETFLLTRLLEIGGLAPKTPFADPGFSRQRPVAMGGKTANWRDLQQNLEMKAREEYWEQRKKEQEAKEKVNQGSEFFATDRRREMDEIEKKIL